MTKSQARLLLEVEYNFYRLGEDPERFSALLVRMGYKPVPDLAKLDDEGLKHLNFRLRSVLRSVQSLN